MVRELREVVSVRREHALRKLENKQSGDNMVNTFECYIKCYSKVGYELRRGPVNPIIRES